MPGLFNFNPGKLATPRLKCTVRLPVSLLLPGFFLSATVTVPVKVVTTFPYWSSPETARPKGVFTGTLLGGWLVTTSWVAAAGVTLKELVMAETKPVLAAWMV